MDAAVLQRSRWSPDLWTGTDDVSRRAEVFHALQSTPRSWTEVEERDTVNSVMDLGLQHGAEASPLGVREVAHEHRVLQRLAEIRRNAMHAAETSRLPDVIHEQVPGARCHRIYSASCQRSVRRELSQQDRGEHSCLQFQASPIADPIAKQGMTDLLCHPPLVRGDEASPAGVG